MKIQTMSTTLKSDLPYRLLYLTLLLGLLSYQTPIHADPAIRQYDIPAGSLATAINQLAETGNIQAIYDTQTTQGRVSKGLKGSYSTEAALQKLLAGTGLVHSLIDGTATIRAGAKPVPKPFLPVANPSPNNPEPMSESTLPKVTVEADAEQAYDPEYYADPYNKDYVIPNATAGTKTDTPIMETPLNVQVISKQVLKDQQVIRLGDALKNVSGVVTATSAKADQQNFASQTLFLRGFESQTFFRNGFRLQEGAASKGLANVESIEVLKGPAAILYGLVEPGGMVNVVTKQPLATPYYGFNQQFGSYDLYRTTFDATGPIANNKDVLYRMNMSYENSGSFRDLVGIEDVFLAPVLKWNISPKTQVTFEMEYNHQHQGFDIGFIPLDNGQPSNIPRSRNYSEYSPVTTETIFGGFNWSHQFNDDWLLKHRFSVNQTSQTFYGLVPSALGTKTVLQDLLTSAGFGFDPNLALLPNNNDLLILRTQYGSISQNNTYSTNLDLVGHFDTAWLKHTLLLGGDYYRLDDSSTLFDKGDSLSQISYISANNPVHPGTPPGNDPLRFRLGSSTQTDQYGLYIQDQIKLPYDVQVMGGIRYQYIHQNSGGDGQTQDAVTPRVGILWQPKKWLSLYANYAESFGANSGRTFISQNQSGIVAPSSAAQYEGGIKAEFFDGKLRANLAYYDLTKTNVKVGDPAHPGPTDCAGGSCFLAIGEVRSRGPELDITGEILPGWNVIATWANTDIIVTKTNAAGEAINGINPGGRLTGVPRNTGSIWSTYEVQDGRLKGFKFGGGATLRDRQLSPTISGTPPKLSGYATFDLMAGYSRDVGDAKVSVQLNVSNLLNKHYFAGLSFSPDSGVTYADFGQPRTLMGSISIQY